MLAIDIIEVVFWYVVFRSYQWAMAIVMAIVPTALARKVAQDSFAQCNVKISMDQDREVGKYDKDKYRCEVIVHNPKTFKRVQVEDILGIGESYMVRMYYV